MHWAEPRNFSDWCKRLFGARSLMVGLLFLVVITSDDRLSIIGGEDLSALRRHGEEQTSLSITQCPSIPSLHNAPFRVLL